MPRLIGSLGGTQQAVLRELRRRGAASRAELAAACGVTAAAMSVITRDLVAEKLICEGGRRHGGRGAPQIDLTLSGAVGVALGVHATRHVVALSLLDFRGEILAEARIPGDFSSFSQVLDTILAGIAELRRSAGASAPLIGAGVALPTRFQGATRGLDLADEVTSWRDAAIVDTLEAALGCPVRVENDANAAAIGELSLGNAAGHRDFAYLYLSEGIGGALVLNGALYRGMRGNAGEFGALVPRGQPRPSFEDLADFCRAGARTAPPEGRDPAAWASYLDTEAEVVGRWIDRAVPQVARLVFVVTAMIAPAAVCIGGTLPQALRAALRARVDPGATEATQGGRVVRPELVLPDVEAADAVAFGAAALILLGPEAG